jgi:hypothetical protein
MSCIQGFEMEHELANRCRIPRVNVCELRVPQLYSRAWARRLSASGVPFRLLVFEARRSTSLHEASEPFRGEETINSRAREVPQIPLVQLEDPTDDPGRFVQILIGDQT